MIYSVEAEQAVLGGLLKDGDKHRVVSDILTSDDFFRADHRFIYQAVERLAKDRKPIDAITLVDQLEASGNLKAVDQGYVLDLQLNTPSTANLIAYARIVADKAKRRQLINVMQESCLSVESSDEPIESIAANAAAMIGSLQAKHRLNLTRNTNDVLSDLVKTIDKRLNATSHIDGLPTGIKNLDERYCGWKAGDLVVLAARPSMGKSALGFQIAQHNALAGNRVMAFSLEMTAEQIMERATANVGRINLGHLRDPKRDHGGDLWTRLNVAIGKLKDLPLIIDETPGLHVNQICARARTEHAKSPLSLVLVDHISIARGDGQSREREMASITGSLKGLAKELGCPVLAICQLNRGVEQRPNKRPLMSDLRDSGAIEQDADIVMMLYRDEYYNEDTPDKGILEVITGKFRQGEVGRDFCAAKLHMSLIEDLDRTYIPEDKPAKKGFDY